MTFARFEILTAFPQWPSFDQRITLGGRQFTIVTHWRDRLRGWFIDVFDDEGDPVFTNKRINPGANLAMGQLDFPGGLMAFGDPSERRNLGSSLFVAYVEVE